MVRTKLPLVVAASVAALVLSLLLAACTGGGHHPAAASTAPSGAPCAVQALTCSPGQFDPADSAPPAGDPATDAAGDAKAPGTARPKPTPTRPPAARTRAPGGPCASPGACGFPDARSTGPRIALKTHKSGDLTIRTDNMVIRAWDLTGSLDVYANDVTVIDSRVTSTNWWGVNLRPGFHGLRVLHTALTGTPGKGPDHGGEDYAVSNMSASLVEVGWSDVSVFGDALSMGQGNLHDNYVHAISPFVNLDGQWQHTDAVISDGGGTGRLTISHNTLLNSTPIDKGASASVGLYADTNPVTNTVVDRNWMAGGAYCLYGGSTGANGIHVTGNVFSTEYHKNCGAYGVVAYWNAGGAGNVWSGNRMSDGTPVAVPKPA
jgi:hypothetical protein